MNRLWKFFASLRLTATLLALGIVLVWVGTIAQADEGLYQAQQRYFKQWLVVGFHLFGHHIPLVLPGGYLLGTSLLVNLVAAHISRFQRSWKKLGIHLTHTGIILLLVGQLTTDLLSRETQLQFTEGETKNYSESYDNYELVFTSDAGGGLQDVVAIPAKLLASGGEIKSAHLPFAVRVKHFLVNSQLSFRAPMMTNLPPPLAPNGVAQHFDFVATPEVRTTEEKNIPSALIEIGGAGEWMASGWVGEPSMIETVRQSYSRQMGEQMAGAIARHLAVPQVVVAGGKQFTFALRPERVYTPFSLELVKATHSVYPGTDIPKDFRSRVRLQNPKTGEDRELEIFMNTPLRYGGLTFYQYQMAAGEDAARAGRTPSSTLQVVRNPGWLTPYAGCSLVALGLVTQFLYHLVGFVKKRRTN